MVWGLGGSPPLSLVVWGVVGGNPPSSSFPVVWSCGWDRIPSFLPCGVGSGGWEFPPSPLCGVGFGGVEFVLGSLGGLVVVVKLL